MIVMKVDWLICAILLMAVLTAPLRAADLPVVIINTGESPPFMSESLPGGGAGPELIREAYSRAGYRAEVRFRPWKRALLEGRLGKVDGVSFSVKDEGRKQHYLFSDVVVEYSRHFYHLKSRPFDWRKLEDLKGLTIALDSGFRYPPDFLQAGKDNLFHLIPGRGLSPNLRLLLSGRIDLYPRTAGEVEFMLKTQFGEAARQKIARHPRPFETVAFHVIFGKKGKQAEIFRDAFNQGLNEIRADGTLDRLLDGALSF